MTCKSNNVSNCCCQTSTWAQTATELKLIIFSWFRPKEPNYMFGKVPLTVSFMGLSVRFGLELTFWGTTETTVAARKAHLIKPQEQLCVKGSVFPPCSFSHESSCSVTWGNFPHFDCLCHNNCIPFVVATVVFFIVLLDRYVENKFSENFYK